MEDISIKCPYCGEELSITMHGNVCVITCPHCGHQIRVQKLGDDIFSIDENLYQVGSNVPLENNKDYWIACCNWFIKKWGLFKSSPTYVKILTIIVLLLIILTPIGYAIATAPNDIHTTMAYDDKEALWSEFRTANPYNIQTVGIKSYEDGSYSILLSEPEEDVHIEQLQKLFAKYNAYDTTFVYNFGYDGWLKDIIICFNDIDESKLPQLQSKLFTLLYGTDYKAYFYDLSKMPHHVDYAFEPLNYQISDQELKQWVVDSDEHFINENIPYDNTFNNLMSLDAPQEGVFYSASPGLVIWLISPEIIKEPDFKVHARMFSLDADLIFGAFKNDKKIAIIGRERTSPLNELPPMRLSTILMLASTTEKELSQSYERNNFFAGKLPGGKDYAPILLSDELWHTEYGSILNITDQMLKSWSENGRISYEGFNYPKPIDWAFEKGAIKDLAASTLTYNWNTAGAGYIVEASEDCEYDIFAVNRTGSLPVSYIPGETDEVDENDRTYKAEETAYDFFSNLSNPELVRVNQYASLYQIFANFGVSIPQYKNFNPVTTNQLDVVMGNIIKKLKDFRDDEALRDSVKKHYEEEIPSEYKRLSESPYLSEENKIYIYLMMWLSDPKEDAKKAIASMKKISDVISGFRFKYAYEDKYERVGHYFINPREIDYDKIGWLVYYWDDLNQLRRDNDIPLSEDNSILSALNLNINNLSALKRKNSSKPYVSDEDLRTQMVAQSTEEEMYMFNAHQLLKHIDEIKKFNESTKICPLQEAKEIYLAENAEVSNQWIKCPTIVQSWQDNDSLLSIGGHNLNSRITPVRIDPALKKGSYKIELVNGKKQMVISPEDRGVSPSILRLAERTNKAGTFKYTKAQALLPRSRNVVLASAERRSARGFNVDDHIRIISDNTGFRIGEKHVQTIDELFSEVHAQLLAENANGSKTLIFENVNERTVKLISKDIEKAVYLDKGNVSRVERSSNFNKVVYDNSREAEGIVIVKVPVVSELPNPNVQARFHIFEVPKIHLETFKNRLKIFLKDVKKNRDFKLLKKSLKESEIDVDEIRETEQYMIVKLNYPKTNQYVWTIQKEAA